MTQDVLKNLDPVTLSYVSAIRGLRPRIPGEMFSYGLLGLRAIEGFCAMAASSPEGQFFGFADAQATAIAAAEAAAASGLKNAMFDAATPADLTAQIGKGVFSLPKLDYLVCAEATLTHDEKNSEKLASAAKSLLHPGGLFAVRYDVSDSGPKGILANLLASIRDEGGDALQALRHMAIYAQNLLQSAPEIRSAIEMAISDQSPALAFAHAGPPTRTARYQEAMRKAGLSYVGQMDIKANYLEMAARPETHEAILAQRGKPYYEVAKDAAMGTTQRLDLYVLEPAQRQENLVTLFGGFAYGITGEAADVPRVMETPGKTFSLAADLYQKIIVHLADIPCTIGDLLSQENIQANPLEVLTAVQLMVAGDVVQVLRMPYPGSSGANMQKPTLQGAHNQTLTAAAPENLKHGFSFSSEVMGRAWAVPGLEAIIIREIDRTGFTELPSMLAPHLVHLKHDPRLAGWDLDNREEQLQAAAEMVVQICQRNLMYWFSYGIFKS